MHSFWLASVPRTVLDTMLRDLQNSGNTVEPVINPQIPNHLPTWLVKGSGITAEVIYEESSQRALVQIHEKPWLVPVSYIEQKVRESLKVARG